MPNSAPEAPLFFNRLREVLLHIPYYSIEPNARLGADIDLSESAVSRIVRRRLNPSAMTMRRIVRAIHSRSDLALRPREIFSREGDYPTPSTCLLCGCGGCLPPEAWNEQTDKLRPQWRNAKPGEWSRRQADPSSPGITHLIDIS